MEMNEADAGALARESGADALELYFSSSESVSVEFSSGELRKRSFISEDGVGVRALKAGKVGFSSTNAVEKAGETAWAAVKAASVSPATEFSFAGPAKCPSMKLVDKKIAELDEGELGESIREALDAARQYAEPLSAHLEFSNEKEGIRNSGGLEAECPGTGCSFYLEATKGGFLGFSYYSSYRMPESFSALGEEAGEMAAAMEGAKPIESGLYDVVFSVEALSQMLGLLMFHFSSEQKRRGISRLEEGAEMFDPKLTVKESLLAEGSSRWPFDAEGVPAQENMLIEGGVVKRLLFDRYTASRMGRGEQGCCTRASHDAPPVPGYSNLVVSPGKGFDGDAKLLRVESFHGMHTASGPEGEFGVEVDIAFLAEKGEKRPATDLLLTGNVFNLFKNISGIGKKSECKSDVTAPEIVFSGVRVVGK